MNKETTVLLIGGSGFLGAALTRRLKRDGYGVHHLVREPIASQEAGVAVHAGGLGNVELLRRLLPECGVVFHLASGTTPTISAKDPSLEAELNIFPTLRFLEVLHNFPQTKLIYISSGGTVYGNPGDQMATETTPLASLSYYGAGKIATEAFLLTYKRTYKRRVSILRPSNLYGPEQPLLQNFGIVRTMLQRCLDNQPIDIWGDGEVVRDFLYLDDLVEACMQVMQCHAPNDIYNIGAGEGHSLNQLADIIKATCNKPLDIRYSSSRSIDVKRIVLDCHRIQADLGWKPMVTLENGIRRTWDWLLTPTRGIK